MTQPPPAAGVRLDWLAVPANVRAAVEQWLGSEIVSAVSQASGFTPGIAARLTLADHRRVFVKAAGPVPNPDLPAIYRREALVNAALPPGTPAPRLLWSYNQPESEWVVLLFEDLDGRHPAQPWRIDELERVLDAIGSLAALLTPSPLAVSVAGSAQEEFAARLCGWRLLREEQPSYLAELDPWSLRHIDALAEIEATAAAAVAGESLLHFDLRADNMLLTADRVWFVDWPLVCVGAAWVDAIFFAPSVAMQGGPEPEHLIARVPACRAAEPAALTAAIVATAGFFTHRSLQPPPPGLPTVRAFQAAQGVVARAWVAERTGLV